MTKSKTILEHIEEINPDAIKIDNFDDCIIGIINSFDGARLLYSESKIINKLSKEMSTEEAWEYYEFNILGAHFGQYNPAFLIDMENENE